MNNKGFTLIEVIITLSIIAIISLILIPTVNTLIEKQNENSINNFIESIETSALNYAKENKWQLGINCSDNKNTIIVTLKYLLENDYIKGTEENNVKVIKNPVTKENINLDKTVTITYNCENKTFSSTFTLQ